MRKGEIACHKQFLLFSQRFLPYMAHIFHFKCTLKCRLQFVRIWTSLKFCRLVISLKNTCIWLLVHFYFLFQLVGGAATGLMAWVLVEKEKEVDNAYDFFLDPVCVLCLAGAIAALVSFFGWFGSLRENTLVLKIVSLFGFLRIVYCVCL